MSLALRIRTWRLLRWIGSSSRAILRGALRWGTLFIGIVVFAVLATHLRSAGEFGFDAPLLGWFQLGHGGALERLVRGITWLGAGVVMAVLVVLVGLFLLYRQHARGAVFVWVVAVGIGLMNWGLKVLFARERPDLLLQLTSPSGYSFPSGHSMGSAAIYASFAMVLASRFPERRVLIGSVAALLILAIGTSRMYLQVHYPSDVLAGWALGLTWPLWLRPVILGRKKLKEEAERGHIALPSQKRRADLPEVVPEEEFEVQKR